MIRLYVDGIPAPQGSKTPIHRNGKTWMIEGGSVTGREKHKTWRLVVHNAARDYLMAHPAPPLDEPCSIRIAFRFPLPKTDQYRTLHASKPDLSKLMRSTEDALVTAGLLRDDSIICEASILKRYARGQDTPGATITIQPMGETETQLRDALKAAAKLARKGDR